jgi:hypothetical protein
MNFGKFGNDPDPGLYQILTKSFVGASVRGNRHHAFSHCHDFPVGRETWRKQ